MRMLVFFDLPIETLENRREYSRFRKFLIKNGFMMIQKSVYGKIALNQTIVDGMAQKIRNNKPKTGLIQMLTITEKQFNRIEFVLGDYAGDIINSDERLIEL